MSWNKIKELEEQAADLVAELSKVCEKSEGEKRSMNSDEKAVFDKIKADLKVNESRRASLQEVIDLEKSIVASKEKRSDPKKEFAANGQKADEVADQREAFRNWILTGESRDLTQASQGGVVAPAYFNNNYVAAVKSSISLLNHGAFDITTDDMNPFYIPTFDDVSNTAQVLAEGATANAATDPTLAAPYLGAYRYTPGALSYTVEMEKNNFYAFEATMTKMLVDQSKRKYNYDSVRGDGSSKATGFLQGATSGVTTSLYNYEAFLDMIFSMDESYRKDPSTRIFVPSAGIALMRRTFEDSSGRLLFGPNEKLVIEEIPVIENNNMPALNNGNVGAAIVTCGNYYVRSVNQLSIVRDNITAAASGKIKLHVSTWHDGKQIHLAHSVRTMTLSASVS